MGDIQEAKVPDWKAAWEHEKPHQHAMERGKKDYLKLCQTEHTESARSHAKLHKALESVLEHAKGVKEEHSFGKNGLEKLKKCKDYHKGMEQYHSKLADNHASEYEKPAQKKKD